MMGNQPDSHAHDDEQKQPPIFQTYDLAEIRRNPHNRIVVGDAVHITLIGRPEAAPPPGETALTALQLDVRTLSLLRRAGFRYVSQIVTLADDDLLAIQHFNARCLAQLKGQLQAFGFTQ